jgi:hypothetical protein
MGAARDLRGAARHAATLRAKPGRWRTSPRTSLALPPTRSRPHVLPRWKARARPQGALSAGGSVTSFQSRFASSYLMPSGCGTKSAGQCLTAERASGRQGGPQAHRADVVSSDRRVCLDGFGPRSRCLGPNTHPEAAVRRRLSETGGCAASGQAIGRRSTETSWSIDNLCLCMISRSRRTAESEFSHAGMADSAGAHREAESLGFLVEVCERRPACSRAGVLAAPGLASRCGRARSSAGSLSPK